MRIFIPVTPRSASKSKNRQEFIAKARKYIPRKYKNLTKDRHKKYACYVGFYFFGGSSCDIDNSLKAVLDSIDGWYIPNDRQVKRMVGS
jgi:Holliday junction resolvase RusA-like endonuclease